MTDVAIEVEILTDKDMFVDYYNIDTSNLGNYDPLQELKALETLIKALRLFEDTKLYDIISKGIEVRLAKMLAYFEDKVRPK